MSYSAFKMLLILADGVFGAMMKVSLVNDGPVTMQLDSQSPKNSVDAAES
ncbi:hypothetical protein QN277_006008 [Acacia crassicarpa]|uniref:Uncharacterized protein n=1 Tax=Acacia crassicarpa TaxID=499986 RepID=A0AAE1IXD9_9FABA|nr:hypothetical protein QN277_006008 [Acacia crassicarpa]